MARVSRLTTRSWVPPRLSPPRFLRRANRSRPHPFGKGRGGWGCILACEEVVALVVEPSWGGTGLGCWVGPIVFAVLSSLGFVSSSSLAFVWHSCRPPPWGSYRRCWCSRRRRPWGSFQRVSWVQEGEMGENEPRQMSRPVFVTHYAGLPFPWSPLVVLNPPFLRRTSISRPHL